MRRLRATILDAIGGLAGTVESARTDAIGDERDRVRKALSKIPERFRHLPDVHNTALRIANHNLREFRRVFKLDEKGAVQHVDMRGTLGLTPAINQFQERNANLITRMRDDTIKDVRETLDAGWSRGARVEELRADLQERFGVSESRADLIARDQTLKLNAQITQTRQQSAGVQKYIWTTSGDERVRGDPGGLYPNSDRDHYSLDGQTFSWDAPPVINSKTGETAHPGGDYQCRCTAFPVLDVFDENED